MVRVRKRVCLADPRTVLVCKKICGSGSADIRVRSPHTSDVYRSSFYMLSIFRAIFPPVPLPCCITANFSAIETCRLANVEISSRPTVQTSLPISPPILMELSPILVKRVIDKASAILVCHKYHDTNTFSLPMMLES